MNVEKAAGETRAELADRLEERITARRRDYLDARSAGEAFLAYQVPVPLDEANAILAALRVPAAPSFIPPLDLADQLQAAILEFRNPYQNPDTAPERAADLALWIVEHESRLLSALRASVPVRAGVDQRDRRPLHPPGLDAVTDAPAAPAALNVERLREAARRARLPHDVTVADIENIAAEYAALAPSAGSSGTAFEDRIERTRRAGEEALRGLHLATRESHGHPVEQCPERKFRDLWAFLRPESAAEQPSHPAAPSIGEAQG